MKGGRNTGGFTMVETLIVLAVTGILFVSAAAMISGRQNRTEFEQGIRNIHDEIQHIINETTSGYYPNRNNFSCAAGGSGPVISAGGSAQGSNSGCMFLGKVMQFKVGATSPEEYAVYSVAGLRRTAAGAQPATLADAIPRVIAPSTSNPSWPNVTIRKPLQYGLTTAWMRYSTGGPAQNIGAVGFVSSLSHYSETEGAHQLNLVPITSTSLGAEPQAMAQDINTRLAASPLDPSGGVTICFASAGTNQSGLVTIGGSGRQLTATLKIISGNKTCA